MPFAEVISSFPILHHHEHLLHYVNNYVNLLSCQSAAMNWVLTACRCLKSLNVRRCIIQ